MWPMSLNLRIKLDKRLKSDLRGEKGEIFAGKKNKRREKRERVEKQAPTSLYDLRSSVARFSSDQE